MSAESFTDFFVKRTEKLFLPPVLTRTLLYQQSRRNHSYPKTGSDTLTRPRPQNRPPLVTIVRLQKDPM